MAKLSVTIVLSTFILSVLWANVAAQFANGPETALASSQNLCNCKEKVAQLHFYVQDALGGPNRTVWEVARSNITSTSSTGFGQIIAIDDRLTVAPERNSTELGRAQGIITNADLNVPGLAMNINFYFTAGEYNGSTLCILGRNPILNETRELPVVGGTGKFRFARGYSISSTYSFDPVEFYGVLEYNVYVTYRST